VHLTWTVRARITAPLPPEPPVTGWRGRAAAACEQVALALLEAAGRLRGGPGADPAADPVGVIPLHRVVLEPRSAAAEAPAAAVHGEARILAFRRPVA
jgi:hypothetical protein